MRENQRSHRRRAGAVLLAAAALVAVPALHAQTPARTDDPRVGLAPGMTDAEVAALHMTLVSNRPRPDTLNRNQGLSFINSDLAFQGDRIYQGNFSGVSVWNVADPAAPVLEAVVPCGTDQGDPSIYGNLLFISAESPRARTDCGWQGFEPADSVSTLRARGVRIFDVSNPARPELVANVQTCRGSHTHTIVPDANDRNVLYVYVSGTAGVRSPAEMPACADTDYGDPNTAQWRIDIIRVPLDAPEEARVVAFARIFDGLGPAPQRGEPGGGDPGPPDAVQPPGSRGCHDITVYPEMNLAGGACGSYGILLDISDREHPTRIDAAADSNFVFWHSATFSNDGGKVVFTDEWGGGTSPRCRESDPLEWGANTVFTIRDDELDQRAYYKMPAAQTGTENCVAHNGGLVPVPGRDIMVQGWYQGGVSVVDFTDPDNPVEIAYFDRGPIDADQPVVGGHWGAYYYNGYIYASELARGLDVLRLEPSEYLSENELETARLVRLPELNPQTQPHIVWPAAFAVPRAYLDQLVRGQGLPAARTTAIGQALDAAEAATGNERRTALVELARALDRDAEGAADAARVRAMADAVRKLASTT